MIINSLNVIIISLGEREQQTSSQLELEHEFPPNELDPFLNNWFLIPPFKVKNMERKKRGNQY